MSDTFDADRIIITPMRPGACPVCAARHGPNDPHETRSLYFIMGFARRNGRLPTRDDGITMSRNDGMEG